MRANFSMTTKAILLLTASVVATSTGAESTSLFGTPGLIDMPSAEVYDDGNIALTSSYFGGNLRNTHIPDHAAPARIVPV